MSSIEWLRSYSDTAALSDRLIGRDNHLELLAIGLMGEAGSIVAELKKMAREGKSYPTYRNQLEEELGDFLWYFVRVVSICDSSLIDQLVNTRMTAHEKKDIGVALDFGAAVGLVLSGIQAKKQCELRDQILLVWKYLDAIAHDAEIQLNLVANRNYAKTHSRWPERKEYIELFDDKDPVAEKLPRNITIAFVQNTIGSRVEVLLRANGINIGNRLTDNIVDPDGYRFHDIFHIAFAVHLGWSPVLRALFRCKRKSSASKDENEDGARALIIEEAISAIIFSRAKHMRFFEGTIQVDYDLLKTIKEFTKGFEVDKVPLWQWEAAILSGFENFRALLRHEGGCVTWDLCKHSLTWAPHPQEEE